MKAARYRWSELRPFSVTETYEGDGYTVYWVTASLADDDPRRRGLVDIRAYEYIYGDGKADAQRFADWLNDVRSQALSATGLRNITPYPQLREKPFSMNVSGTHVTD